MLVKGMCMSVPQVSLFHHGIQMPTWVSSVNSLNAIKLQPKGLREKTYVLLPSTKYFKNSFRYRGATFRKLSHTRGVMTKNFNIRLQNVLFPFLTNVESICVIGEREIKVYNVLS